MAGVYEEKDFVEIVDGDGDPVEGFEHPVPKQWIGTDLLPAGAKKKGGRSSGKPAVSNGDEGKGQQSQPNPPAPEVFDPSEHNQDKVLEYLATAEPDEIERVKAAEADGKDRKEIAGFVEPAAPSGEGNKTGSEGS